MEPDRVEIKSAPQKKVKRWGYVLLIPLLMCVIALSVISSRWRESLKVQHLDISGARIVPSEHVKGLMKVPLQSLLDTIDLYAVRERILRQPFIRSAKVTVVYPDGIQIQVGEREPIASLNTGQLRYVDREAFLLPTIESFVKLDLPIISGVDSLKQKKVGETIQNEELTQAIELLETAQSVDSALYHSISEINMSGGKDIFLFLTDVGVQVIVGREEFRRKLIMLQAFWSNFVKSQDISRLQCVDLRFADQVVVRWKTDSQQPKTTL
jgi:cell division septal protein FtsQ